ncbi:PAS domain-containing protein [Methylovirgula sp. 4M-Z18]|nr:PAS domain-containing protein [Methylovirgula sp. 4M-Z18]
MAFAAGAVVSAIVAALAHLAGRRRRTARVARLRAANADLQAKAASAQALLATEPQILIAWNSPHGEPEIEGDLSLIASEAERRPVLGFGSWLPLATALQMERRVEALRSRGEGFHMAIQSLAGRHLDAEGRAVGGRAILRVRDVSGDRLDLTRLREQHAQIAAGLDTLKALLDAMPDPAWTRDQAGRLTWANAAYARAVEAPQGTDAVAAQLELLDRPARVAADDARRERRIWQGQVNAIVAGARHMLNVLDVPVPQGSVGIAADRSDLEAARADFARQMDSHARTLDQLTTAVAIFDGAKRLVFHNAAYRQLWPLDAAFLDQHPSDGEILDHLRAERRLPEQADFRAWKAGLMAAYTSLESAEHIWHIPDGRTLRAVTSPNSQGGVTYLFDDVTERQNLEAKYNALYRVQSETLDTLKEGVAVFGMDGRLNLFNPAFAEMWKLDLAELEGRPHVDKVARLCEPLSPSAETWRGIRSVVSGLHDARTALTDRLTRGDGMVIDYSAAPLPDGATLLTFTDVTAGVNVERALKERNQALIDAEKLRNDFVHHVSYELRSPLTSITGFIELLGGEMVGPLNAKQREYCEAISKSSAALLAIIGDILDLATIDRGAMALELSSVDVEKTIAAAALGVQDRIDEMKLRLDISVAPDIDPFVADVKRLRQILFNLLSNAVGFSQPHQVVSLSAARQGEEIVFTVRDSGRGIPRELLDRVFNRFETHTNGSRHRGVGLGLAMVRSFVELHGGRVHIESVRGEGTTVTCIFPASPVTQRLQEKDRPDDVSIVDAAIHLAH